MTDSNGGTRKAHGSPVARLAAVFALIAGLFAVGTLGAGAAGAVDPAAVDDAECPSQGYAPTPVLTADPGEVTPGATVTITGTGFVGGSTAVLEADGVEIGQVPVDADGSFTFEWTVPADHATGPVEITATDGCLLISSTVIEVVSTPATTVPPADTTPADAGTTPGGGPSAGDTSGGSGVLPKTGSQILPAMVGGLVLLVVGSGLVVLATRRRRADSV